jgi:hypothetical protein
MRTPKLLLLTVIAILSLAGIVRADSGTYSMTGGFTSFSGVVGGNADPNYIRALGLNQSIDCGGADCSNPLLLFEQVCPSAGCSTETGPSAADSLLSAGLPSNYLTFESFGCPPTASPICANTPNRLDFVPATDSILGFNQQTGQTEMLLGSLTFANGVWTGDADFGITITATDILDPHNAYTFTGLLHMTLNTAPPGVTNPALIAQDNADCISLTDQSGQPLSTFEDKGFCAYELNNGLGLSNTTTVNLYGTIGSLDPMRYGDVTGGFIVDDSGGFIVPVQATPEPELWPVISALLVIGVVIGYRCDRRAKQAS